MVSASSELKPTKLNDQGEPPAQSTDAVAEAVAAILRILPNKTEIEALSASILSLKADVLQSQQQITDLKRSMTDLRYQSKLEGALSSATYFNAHLYGKPIFEDKGKLIVHSIGLLNGRVDTPMEFGVFSGRSINLIANSIGIGTKVYGFDSFEGLPEDWRGNFKKGTFSVPTLPEVRQNVELVKGWFDQTLPRFTSERLNGKKTNFLHIDCDLYSSTKTIFDTLIEHIADDCVIVFDEYFNYPGWQDHEVKAFKEFIEMTGYSYEYIGCVPTHQQLAIRLTGKRQSMKGYEAAGGVGDRHAGKNTIQF
ncbi:class I SAM-dependent methyltransferase [Rhizobium arsenicireducens]